LDNRGDRELSMQNPSVNDFLDGRLLRDNAERTELLSSICMVKQLRLLPEADRIPYIVNLLKTGNIDQFIFPEPQSRSAVIGHCILASGLCMDIYRAEFLDYLMNRRYSSFPYNSSLPGGLNIRKRIFDTEIWNYYELKTHFEESDHLYRFLSFWDLENGVDLIRSMDDYFHGKNRIFYVQQVEEYLVEAIEEYCNVDASDYDISLDVDSAIRSAAAFGPDGYDVDEDEAAAILDECVREEAFNEFENIIARLPEHFRFLADHIQEDDFIVDGSDSLVEEYLSDPPGHYEPDDDKDFDDHPPYSPIDAIFQR